MDGNRYLRLTERIHTVRTSATANEVRKLIMQEEDDEDRESLLAMLNMAMVVAGLIKGKGGTPAGGARRRQ
jgi:hypothetical protein